jgi:hypothetical protein
MKVSKHPARMKVGKHPVMINVSKHQARDEGFKISC